MGIRRYAIVDADGVKLNTITADDALLETGWYPGYGAKLVDEGEEPPEPPRPTAPPRPDDFGVLDVVPSEPMATGDKIDFKTGKVTKAEIKPEVIAVDAQAEKLP